MNKNQRPISNIAKRALVPLLILLLPALAGCMNLRSPEKTSPVIEEITEPGGVVYDIAIRDHAVDGNRVRLLLDGPTTYNAMFEAMEKAQDHINLETFILADDEIGRRLSELLIDRVKAGVKVNVIYDALGSGMTDDDYFDKLSDNGINVLTFRPPLETKPWNLLNRNHRKVLVVDGRIGFTGGLNFTRKYRFDSENPPEGDRFGEAWRDTHVRIEGPAVVDMQRAFLRNWAEHSDDGLIPAASYFPKAKAVGDQDVLIVVAEGGDTRGSRIFDHYIAAIRKAEKRVWITQAYFIPNSELLDALHAAAQRGVDVRLILPRRTDNGVTIPATRSYYSGLLDSGARIYEYRTSHLHAKTALVDDDWSTVGSSNLDSLSYLYNDELNAVVIDKPFNAEMAASFIDDMSESDEILPEQWDDRGLWPRIKEAAARLLKPVL